jgi:hypothetical protein
VRVYIATAFPRAVDLAIPYAGRLEVAGLTISHKWWSAETTKALEAAGSIAAGPRNETLLPLEQQRKYALDDLRGVETADLVWVMAPEAGGTGCWWEAGFASALGKATVISGPPRTIFASLPHVRRFESHDSALVELTTFVQGNVKRATAIGWGPLLYDWVRA